MRHPATTSGTQDAPPTPLPRATTRSASTPIIAVPFTYHTLRKNAERWLSSLSASGRKREAADRSITIELPNCPSNPPTAGVSQRNRNRRCGRFRPGQSDRKSFARFVHRPITSARFQRCPLSIERDAESRCTSHRCSCTRVFSVRPPQRYCQSGYSCLGRDQYGLDSRDDPDDDQLLRAIDWRMARIVHDAKDRRGRHRTAASRIFFSLFFSFFNIYCNYLLLPVEKYICPNNHVRYINRVI